MPGTKAGAAKAQITNLNKYGKTDEGKSALHARAGSIGGSNGTGHKFAHGMVDPRIAGSKGGRRKKQDE